MNTDNLSKSIWLNYFNNVLFEKGIITETERNKMRNLICTQNHHAQQIKLQSKNTNF